MWRWTTRIQASDGPRLWLDLMEALVAMHCRIGTRRDRPSSNGQEWGAIAKIRPRGRCRIIVAKIRRLSTIAKYAAPLYFVRSPGDTQRPMPPRHTLRWRNEGTAMGRSCEAPAPRGALPDHSQYVPRSRRPAGGLLPLSIDGKAIIHKQSRGPPLMWLEGTVTPSQRGSSGIAPGTVRTALPRSRQGR